MKRSMARPRLGPRSLLPAVLLLGLAVGAAQARIEQDVRCFRSSEGAAPIRFEFRMFYDSDTNWSGGYVRYKGSKTVIPIVLKSEHGTELAPGRPDEFDRTWVEVIDGRLGGEYRMLSQGAIVESMSYTKPSPRRSLGFVDDPGSFTSDSTACQW
ncbi:hypothetical protein DRA46_05892 [Burkholderia gladioli]|nr:hypothetical protein [Burkholderia gladioli]